MSNSKSKRILICGHEIGGQMQLLAKTFRANGYEALAVSFNKDFRNYNCDINLRGKFGGILFQVKKAIFSLWAIPKYDIFYFFWGVSLLDFWRFKYLDLPILKILGKKIFVHFRGTDIKNIKRYKDYVNMSVGQISELIRKDQSKTIKVWRRFADKMFVSTPDLMEIVPDALLLPQCISLSDYTILRDNIIQNDKDLIRIVHAPTRRVIKGTDKLIFAIERLKSKGYNIKLEIIEGKEHKEVLKLMAGADIGFDQLYSGWYGKAAIEMMALGIPVIGYINNKYTQIFSALPVINASEDNLDKIIEKLIDNPDKRGLFSKKSYKYVMKHHNVDNQVKSLVEIFGIN